MCLFQKGPKYLFLLVISGSSCASRGEGGGGGSPVYENGILIITLQPLNRTLWPLKMKPFYVLQTSGNNYWVSWRHLRWTETSPTQQQKLNNSSFHKICQKLQCNDIFTFLKHKLVVGWPRTCILWGYQRTCKSCRKNYIAAYLSDALKLHTKTH
jgi:hypothetical protein